MKKKILINYKKDIRIKLKNEGNICYANSSMQLLLHCRYLTEYKYKLKEYNHLLLIIIINLLKNFYLVGRGLQYIIYFI